LRLANDQVAARAALALAKVGLGGGRARRRVDAFPRDGSAAANNTVDADAALCAACPAGGGRGRSGRAGHPLRRPPASYRRFINRITLFAETNCVSTDTHVTTGAIRLPEYVSSK
jgi:hypothetical protein